MNEKLWYFKEKLFILIFFLNGRMRLSVGIKSVCCKDGTTMGIKLQVLILDVQKVWSLESLWKLK